MKTLLDWFDQRTGYRQARDEALLEPIPGGSRWAYVWGSTLVYTFIVQMITGVFLWTAYSPSAQSAWESVYYIQYVMEWGNYVRGIHHFAAQAMTVLLVFHFIQIVWHKAYLAPREVNYWLGLVLMLIVLGLGLTGYLLPWDQKGYYATKVATSIMSSAPGIGPEMQLIVQGGNEYGHHTLTRFFALHVGILPGLLIGFLALHIMVFRRHGITVPDPHRRPEGKFWPDQILKDAIACAAVLAILLALAYYKGAELSAPADPSEAYSAARPEWYFLFLFRFLKIQAVDEAGVAFGAIYVPTVIMLFLFAMPIIGLIRKKTGAAFGAAGLLALLTAGVGYIAWSHFHEIAPLSIMGTSIPMWIVAQLTLTVPMLLFTVAMVFGGHRFNLSVILYLVIGVASLTGIALYEDSQSEAFASAEERAHLDAMRIKELAASPDGIPPAGAVTLLRNDPFTQGPRIYQKNCSACHLYNGHNGMGTVPMKVVDGKKVPQEGNAADLGNFGSRQWLRDVLINYDDVFKPLKNNNWYDEEEGIYLHGDMAAFSKANHDILTDPENKKHFDALIEFLAAQGEVVKDVDLTQVELGQEVFTGTLARGEFADYSTCDGCHLLTTKKNAELGIDAEEVGLGEEVDLTGYASRQWLRDFIRNPAAERFYGPDKNHMPIYEDKLSEKELEMLVRWMTGEYIETKLKSEPAKGGVAEKQADEEPSAE